MIEVIVSGGRVPRVEIKIFDSRLNAIPGWDLRRATPGSAGIDVRACIHAGIDIHPGECKLIPLGFALNIADPGLCAVLLPRSGLGASRGIVLGNLVGLVDSDYQGEVKAAIWNRNMDGAAFRVAPGERIAQMVFMPVVRPDLVEVVEGFSPSARGSNGFGSTGA